MSKKTFMATVIIVGFIISTVAGMQTVKVAKANPFLIFHEVNPPPGTPPPHITIYSPQNNTAYSSDKIAISFYVYYILIIFVNYTLDGQTVEVFSMWKNGTATSGWEVPEVNTTLTSPSLPPGNHSLTVAAKAVVYGANRSIFFIDGSSTIFFSTSTQSSQQNLSPPPTATPNLSPSSTCITLSPTLTSILTHSSTQQPTTEPSQTPDRLQIGDFAPVLIPASMILLAIIAVSFSVCFSKRSGMKK